MYKYLLYFLVFSFLGWCVEVVFHVFKTGRVVNRGLAKGPICPIYGVGICLSYLLLRSVESFILLALLSMAVATIVEFSVGWLLERTLGQRLWDYSAERGNILGYVCPRFSLIWGVVCAFAVRLMTRLEPLVNRLENPLMYGAVFILCVISVVDIKVQMTSRKRGERVL